MGPRPERRGSAPSRTSRTRSTASFNGASPREARKHLLFAETTGDRGPVLQWGLAPRGEEASPCTRPKTPTRGFNGASPREARKRSRQQARAFVRALALQWGLAPRGEEARPGMGLPRRGDASMGPRPERRGSEGAAVEGVSFVGASMGPRPERRGSKLEQVARLAGLPGLQWGLAPRGEEAPRWSRRSAAETPRCFNGASPREARKRGR